MFIDLETGVSIIDSVSHLFESWDQIIVKFENRRFFIHFNYPI